MAESVTVLLVKATGQVLATLTRVGDPGGTLKADALAGDRFPVRSSTGDIRVEIDAAELDVQSVPFVEDLLLNPQECVVDDQGQAGLESGTASVTTFNAAGVTVHVSAAVTKETPVWVQADTGSGSSREHTVLKGEVAAGHDSVSIPHTFADGTYDVLALAAGFKPDQSSHTVP
jgi:hypothetical protein